MTVPTTRKKLQVREIVLDEKAQTRAKLEEQVVQDYAAHYRSKDKIKSVMPEPDCFEVVGVGYVCIDGFHRTAAMRMAGLSWCWVNVVGRGTMEDALWAAFARNHQHGLRRSNADKRRTVELALDHVKAKNLSARSLADHCGVGDDLVHDVRKEREARTQLPGPSHVAGKDGKDYPAKRPSARASDPDRQQLRLVQGGKDDGAAAQKEAEREARRSMQEATDAAKGSASSAKPSGDAVPSDAPVTAAIALLKEARLGVARLGRESPHVHTLLEQVAKQVAGIEDMLDAERPVACPGCSGHGCDKCARRGWVSQRVAAMMKGA